MHLNILLSNWLPMSLCVCNGGTDCWRQHHSQRQSPVPAPSQFSEVHFDATNLSADAEEGKRLQANERLNIMNVRAVINRVYMLLLVDITCRNKNKIKRNM